MVVVEALSAFGPGGPFATPDPVNAVASLSRHVATPTKGLLTRLRSRENADLCRDLPSIAPTDDRAGDVVVAKPAADGSNRGVPDGDGEFLRDRAPEHGEAASEAPGAFARRLHREVPKPLVQAIHVVRDIRDCAEAR